MDRRTALPALLILLTSGCGQDLVLPRQGAPALVAVVAGQSQQAIVGGAVQDSLIVKVTDFEGRPVVGQPIGTNLRNGGSIEAASPRTDDGGRLAFWWVLGTQAGTQTVEIGIGDSTGISHPAVFNATAMPDAAKALVQAGGDGQVGETGQLLPDMLAVRVTDKYGNPVSGIKVRWNPGAGVVSPTSSVSNSAGLAETAWTLGGGAGQQSVTAKLDPVPTVTIEFTATATPGAPPILEIATQPSDTAHHNVPFPRQPVIQLEDPDGLPRAVSGVPVTAAVQAGGGSLSGQTTVNTNAAGQAAFTDLSLFGPTGDYVLLFAAPGYVTVTSDNIRLLQRGPSASLSSISADPLTLTAGGASSVITVTMLDSLGLPIAGLTVTLTSTGSGNTMTQPTQVTDANGRTTGSLSSTVAETKRVGASAGPVQLNDKVDITVVPGIPAPATTDAKVPKGRRLRFTDIKITTRDAFGNDIKVGGFASRLHILVSGTNSATPTVLDNGDGTYSASYLPISKGNDRIDITFDGNPINGSPYFSDVN
ncbi:MAG TPA: Ig-like domain-containing protein [Gemmatimonadales bacterium]|nr:Ig-like domain-containing protein [Gemmatimonadales bacterium]